LHAETFSDPLKFLDYARIHRPTVALVDVCMPQMSGLEVQSQLHEISPSTRVVIFTAKDDPLIRSTALNAGASAFLTKPFDDEELLTAASHSLRPHEDFLSKLWLRHRHFNSRGHQ
jgi:FixJ family two-component response regulator